jgi:hypothetical protein
MKRQDPFQKPLHVTSTRRLGAYPTAVQPGSLRVSDVLTESVQITPSLHVSALGISLAAPVLAIAYAQKPAKMQRRKGIDRTSRFETSRAADPET